MTTDTTTETSQPGTGEQIARPRFAIGHVGLSAANVEKLAASTSRSACAQS